MSKWRDYVKCNANWILEYTDNYHKCYLWHWWDDLAWYLYTYDNNSSWTNAQRKSYYTTDVTTSVRTSNCY